MTIPHLQGRLRDLGLALAQDPSRIVTRLHEKIEATERGYAELAPLVKQDVKEFMYFSATMWFRTVLEGLPPTEADWAVVEATARRRVHQGVPLSATLHGCRLGSRELWSELLALAAGDQVEREQLVDVFSVYLLDYFDDLAQRLATAYLDEQFQRSRWRDALRYELLNIVFSFPDNDGAFRRAAEALGVDATAPYACLAMDVELPDTLPAHLEGELDRLLVSVSRVLGLPYDGLVRALHRDRLIIWVPAVRGDSVLAIDNAMRRHAALLVSTLGTVRRIGLGLPSAGARGWAASLDEALRALEGGARMGTAQPVLPFSDIVLNESVQRSSAALRYLEAVVERLSHETDLLATLGTFFDEGQHRKRTAELLGIHPNTLNYRLARIEEVLGASLSNAGWVARLQVALALRRASDPSLRRIDPGS